MAIPIEEFKVGQAWSYSALRYGSEPKCYWIIVTMSTCHYINDCTKTYDPNDADTYTTCADTPDLWRHAFSSREWERKPQFDYIPRTPIQSGDRLSFIEE